MGGGGSSGGATPTTPPGYTGGSVMDYTAPIVSPSPVQSTGPNWGQILGGGLQSFGKGMGSAGSTPPTAGSVPEISQISLSGQQQPTPMIPQNNLLDALMRILSGG